MDITTVNQLSGFLQGTFHNLTFGQILTALQNLSSIPVHPYEQAKFKYFGKDYHFPTIHDIPIPTNFNYQTITSTLSTIAQETNTAAMSALSAAETKAMEFIKTGEIPPGMPLKMTDIENMVVLDENIIKKNIEFTEIVKSISLNDIETKPIEIAQKLLSYYTTKTF